MINLYQYTYNLYRFDWFWHNNQFLISLWIFVVQDNKKVKMKMLNYINENVMMITIIICYHNHYWFTPLYTDHWLHIMVILMISQRAYCIENIYVELFLADKKVLNVLMKSWMYKCVNELRMKEYKTILFES